MFQKSLSSGLSFLSLTIFEGGEGGRKSLDLFVWFLGNFGKAFVIGVNLFYFSNIYMSKYSSLFVIN